MIMRRLLFFVTIFYSPIYQLVYVLGQQLHQQQPQQQQQSESQRFTKCLEECLTPMVKIEKSIAYIYRNYDTVCETLEQSAKCAQRCTPEDQNRFYQYTTFYRLHCVEFEEELEDSLECLKEASYKADVICRGKCAQKVDDKRATKEEKQKSVCKSVECSTICYYKEFSNTCSCAKDVLMKLNVRIADESRRLTHPSSIEKLDPMCQRIHDPAYIRERLLETQSGAGAVAVNAVAVNRASGSTQPLLPVKNA